MHPRLAIFDFDGTLADTYSLFLAIGDEVADRYGFRRMDRSDLERLRRLDARELMRLHEVPFWKLPFIARHARKRMGEDLARMPLFPGIEAALAQLAAAGVTVAIVSSNSPANISGALGAKAASHVTHFAGGVSLFGKGRKIRQLLRRTGCPPHEAILIGDELRDANAAREAGIAFGAVAWGYTALEALLAAKPAAVFHAVPDIASLIPASQDASTPRS